MNDLHLKDFQIRAHYDPSTMCIDFHIYGQDYDGKVYGVIDIEFQERDLGSSMGPAFRLFKEMTGNPAQILMDDLWACGIRPSEGAGTAGAMSAVKEHLGDMQKIAWKLLNKIVDEE